ncbi:hypothetical protein HBB16_12995 [Pseudonocardia sp. MCCB 268]|nr:hypothetical protein [Pseudonocardia cytotoxica]
MASVPTSGSSRIPALPGGPVGRGPAWHEFFADYGGKGGEQGATEVDTAESDTWQRGRRTRGELRAGHPRLRHRGRRGRRHRVGPHPEGGPLRVHRDRPVVRLDADVLPPVTPKAEPPPVDEAFLGFAVPAHGSPPRQRFEGRQAMQDGVERLPPRCGVPRTPSPRTS